MNVQTLARAMYAATLDNPLSDVAWRRWDEVRSSWEYKAARLAQQLREYELING